jgi:hypothetical protein
MSDLDDLIDERDGLEYELSAIRTMLKERIEYHTRIVNDTTHASWIRERAQAVVTELELIKKEAS